MKKKVSIERLPEEVRNLLSDQVFIFVGKCFLILMIIGLIGTTFLNIGPLTDLVAIGPMIAGIITVSFFSLKSNKMKIAVSAISVLIVLIYMSLFLIYSNAPAEKIENIACSFLVFVDLSLMTAMMILHFRAMEDSVPVKYDIDIAEYDTETVKHIREYFKMFELPIAIIVLITMIVLSALNTTYFSVFSTLSASFYITAIIIIEIFLDIFIGTKEK